MNSYEQHHGSPEAAAGPKPPSARPLRAGHYCVLAIPFIGLLWPPFYAKWTPEIFGVPFFYAYQFAWIPISAALTAIVYRNINR